MDQDIQARRQALEARRRELMTRKEGLDLAYFRAGKGPDTLETSMRMDEVDERRVKLERELLNLEKELEGLGQG
jgi:hypothetical protein